MFIIHYTYILLLLLYYTLILYTIIMYANVHLLVLLPCLDDEPFCDVHCIICKRLISYPIESISVCCRS